MQENMEFFKGDRTGFEDLVSLKVKGTLSFLPDLKRTIPSWDIFPPTSVFGFLQKNDSRTDRETFL